MSQDDSETAAPRRRRSFWETLLALIFLALSALGWIRFQQALAAWDLLIRLGAQPGPLYIAAGGVLWGILGLAAAVGLWWRAAWGPAAAGAAAIAIPLSYWIDRLWLSPGAGPFTGWPFVLGVTSAWGILVYLVLARPAFIRGRRNKGNTHERE